MEKHNMITALCLVLFIGLTGCGNNFDVSDKYDGVIGLSTPGYSLVEMFDVGVKHTENIYFQRGGLNSTPSIIHIGIRWLIPSIRPKVQHTNFCLRDYIPLTRPLYKRVARTDCWQAALL